MQGIRSFLLLGQNLRPDILDGAGGGTGTVEITLVQARPYGVYLEWDVDSSDMTIKYYEVHRSTSAGGTYAKVGEAENIYRYGLYAQLNGLTPPVTPKNFFTDYSGSVGTTYYYKVRIVYTGFVLGDLGPASTGGASTALPGAAVIPSLPATQSVPPLRSRLGLEWIFGGTTTTIADHLMNFATRPGASFTAWTTDTSTSSKFGSVIRDYPNLFHVIYQPYGKLALADGASYAAVEYPVGTEVPSNEGGPGALAMGTADTDSNTFLEACYYRAANTNFDVVLADFSSAFAAVTAQGIHVSAFISTHFLNSSTRSDAELLSEQGIRHVLAANMGLMIDTSGEIDYKLDPSDSGSNLRINPTYRAIQLALARNVPVWVEPIGVRTGQTQWVNGVVPVGCFSLGNRILVARADSTYTSEAAFLGGSITLMGLGTPYWPPATTYAELYAAIATELTNGNTVCMADGADFINGFTAPQRATLMELAMRPVGHNTRNDRAGRIFRR